MATYLNSVSKPAYLGPVPDDVKAKSHHVLDRQGRLVKFQNPHPSFRPITRGDVVTGTIQSSWPQPKGDEVPFVKPEFLPSRHGSDTLRATWLGHACYYVEYPSGLRVLFDPVFEDRCSPLKCLGPKRFSQPGAAVADLPFVDAVIISHSHYDHLSHPTVLDIKKHHPNAHFFVGMGLEKWFKKCGITNVTEMDWWEDAELVLDLEPTKAASDSNSLGSTASQGAIKARISCLPCQHGSGRTLTDSNTTLWCSWAVTSGSPAKSVWFGGDTGYRWVPRVPEGVDDWGEEYQNLPVNPDFRKIGNLRGPFDLGLIPIGAYDPRWLFCSVHANPRDAVEIFRDTKCKKAMGIHWGGWVLTPEPVMEPIQQLKQALQKKGLPETGVFDSCQIGESREF